MNLTRSGIWERPAEILQELIRFDTTNPPGNEGACIAHVDRLLREAGIATTILARDEARPNLVARLPGQGRAAPLLMYGHADVVTAEGQAWTYPPFEGRLVDGWVWGRGALDMKGGLAMMLAALLRARAEGLVPPGDVLLAVLADEEALSQYGARYLVEEHAGLFRGIRYAVGEIGGVTVHAAGRRTYPIMVAEKQVCSLRATVRGPAGHGAFPIRGGAMAALAGLLHKLDRRRLPVHITPETRRMIEATASALPFPQDRLLRLLLRPALTDRALDLLGPLAAALDPLLHNTVCATGLRGSDTLNVIPAEVSIDLDGRLLPGFGPEVMLAELGALLGEEVHLEVSCYEPGPAAADMGLWDTLAGILRECDPQGTPTPLVLAGVTDARWFSRLGIQTYGFTPLRLPPGLDLWKLMHAADERVPAAALDFGVDALYKLLQRFGAG